MIDHEEALLKDRIILNLFLKSFSVRHAAWTCCYSNVFSGLGKSAVSNLSWFGST